MAKRNPLHYDKKLRTILAHGKVSHWGNVARRNHLLIAQVPPGLRVGTKVMVEIESVPRFCECKQN